MQTAYLNGPSAGEMENAYDRARTSAQAEAKRADRRFKRSARRGHDGESSNVLNQARISGVTEGQYPMAGASESEASRSPIQIARPPEQWRSIEQWSRPGAHLQRYGRTIPFGWRRRKRNEPIAGPNGPPTRARTENPAMFPTRRAIPASRKDNTLWPELSEAKRADSSSQRSARRRNGGE
jgi:hypothetical protein